MKLFTIVLAAGTSSRFGATKQLQPWRGAPLVCHAVALAARTSGESHILVVGHRWHEIVNACRPLSGFVAMNDAYSEGMSTSIRAGVRSVAHVADGILLLLSDQPLVSCAHLKTLCDSWRASPETITASRFAGVLGPPVVFPKQDFAALDSLTGDSGARSVIAGAKHRLTAVAFEPAAVDIDRPEDLAALDRPFRGN